MATGGTSNEIEVVDGTVLGATLCSDSSPCKLAGATLDKVSCFADR